MTKRKSLFAVFAFAFVLSLALIFGVTLFGGTITAQAASAPSYVTVNAQRLYSGYYLESNESTTYFTDATTEPATYVAWYKDGILTLNDYKGGHISAGGDLTIKLKGKNTITSASIGIQMSSCEKLIIDADNEATLNINVLSMENYVIGISVGFGSEVTGNVTITGRSKVNIDCETTNFSAYGIYSKEVTSIEYEASLDVKCVSQQELTGGVGRNYGIYSSRTPVFNTSGTIKIDTSECANVSYCVYSVGNELDLKNGDCLLKYKKEASGSYALYPTMDNAPDGYVMRTSLKDGETVLKQGEAHTVTVENGTDYYEKNSNQYVEGETVSVRTSVDGLIFVKWEGEGVDFADAAKKETTFIMPNKDVTVKAVYDVFAKQPVFVRTGENKGTLSVRLNKEISDGRSIALINSTGEVNSTLYFSQDSSDNLTYKCSDVWSSSVPEGEYRMRVNYQSAYYFYSEPFEVDYTDKTPNASISDVTVIGKRGVEIAPVNFDVTLSYATFKEIAEGTDVSDWFSYIPKGLVAKISAFLEGAKSATITISGKPTETGSMTFVLNIPKEVLATGNDSAITTKYNGNASFSITYPTSYKVKITDGKAQVDGKTTTSVYEGSTVTITADTKEGLAFDKWIVVSGGAVLDSENNATTTFVMPEGAVEIKATFKHVHSFTSVPEKKATCAEAGMKAHSKCEFCGKLFDAEGNEKTEAELTIAIDPNGHVFGELQSEKPATCAATGTKEHKDCTLCHKHFAADGTTEIADITIAIDPTAHDFATEWTKTSDGHYHVCKNDGCPVEHDEIKSHTPDREAATDADPVKCTACGYVIAPALGHTTHRLTLVAEVGATCTREGTKAYYACDGCERKFKDEEGLEEITDESWLVIPTAHKFGAWIDEVPATDEATGTKGHKDCEFCHKHFDNDGNEIVDLTLYKTYDVYSYWGTIQADGKSSKRTGRALAHLEVRAGTVVTIIWEDVRDNSDKVFVKWTYTAVVKFAFEDQNSATTTFVMPKGGVSLNCEYKLIRTVTVENGTLEGGETSKKFTEGDTVKIIAQDKLGGKAFVKWLVKSEGVTLTFDDENSRTTTFVMPRGDVTITAVYKGEHNLVLVDEIPATCTSDGTKRHYVCEDEGCGRKFKDETEAEEITDDSTLVIPKAHKFGTWIDEVPATDEATGTKGHKDCEFCHKHFDKDGNEIEDLTLYKTYGVYSNWGTIQADEQSSTRTGSALASLNVRAGTVVTIIWKDVIDNSNKVFVKWTYRAVVDVVFKNVNSATTTFVMPKGDVWLDCEYKDGGEPAPKHDVTIEGGSSNETKFEAGQTVTITAGEAPEGKEFDKWVVVSGDVTLENANSASTTFVMPDGAVEIKATYKDKIPSGGGETLGGEITPPAKKDGLSGGAIAGIVVGSVAVAGIGGFAIFWFVIKKKKFADLIAAIKGLFKKK